MKSLQTFTTLSFLLAALSATTAFATPSKSSSSKSSSATTSKSANKANVSNKNKASDSPSSKPSSTSAALGGLQQNIGKLPTFIKADSLSLKSDSRTFTYSGNVEVSQGDMKMTAQTMEGNYDENNKIKQLMAKGNVLITKGPQIRATGERAIYDAATETVVLTENPELQQDGSILSADRIRVYLSENRSVGEGTVRVKLIQKNQTSVDPNSMLKSQK